MRFVAVADTHLHHDLLGPIPDGDVFIHAGDLLRLGSLDELSVVARWLEQLPHRFKIVVAGNADWCFVQEPEESLRMLGSNVIYLQDQGTRIECLNIWGSPWQPDYKNGAFNLPRGAALIDKWSLVPGNTDVLVTHGPPRGFGDRSPTGSIGCDDLGRAVRRVCPSLHLFGHAHGDGGLWRDGGVSYANVTTWAGARGPTVLDVNPATRAITEIAGPPPSSAR